MTDAPRVFTKEDLDAVAEAVERFGLHLENDDARTLLHALRATRADLDAVVEQREDALGERDAARAALRGLIREVHLYFDGWTKNLPIGLHNREKEARTALGEPAGQDGG